MHGKPECTRSLPLRGPGFEYVPLYSLRDIHEGGE